MEAERRIAWDRMKIPYPHFIHRMSGIQIHPQASEAVSSCCTYLHAIMPIITSKTSLSLQVPSFHPHLFSHDHIRSNSYHRWRGAPSQPLESLPHVFTPKPRSRTHAGFHPPHFSPNRVTRRKADGTKQHDNPGADHPRHQGGSNHHILAACSAFLPRITSVLRRGRFSLSLVPGRRHSRWRGRIYPGWPSVGLSMFSHYRWLRNHPQRQRLSRFRGPGGTLQWLVSFW